jgi:hypothetical protein
MSLTSYRAAPPRDRVFDRSESGVRFTGLAVTYSPASWDAVPSARRRLTAEFGMGSGVSLALEPPNLQNAPFGCGAAAPFQTCGPPRDRLIRSPLNSGRSTSAGRRWGTHLLPDRNQAYRAISTGQLNASPRLHLRPIDVVVFHGPQGRPGFEGGFPLRCLQRLSCPHIATLHCRGRDNRSTSGAFTPVLSY